MSYSLFLRQSYLDAWDDYMRSIKRFDFPGWNYVYLTASNEKQADAYRQQIMHRMNRSLLPARTRFIVLSDPDGKRVGSGGATLNVLRHLKSHEDSFSALRVLIIHSGGDSKRVPQYSACGKLFSPVPRELPNGKRSTLFDELLIGMSGVPSRMKAGMLVLSGDVLLLLNPLQIEAPASGAAAISIKEDVETGKDHGVYQMDEAGNVGNFLHKQSVQTLKACGAVNLKGKVDIDTGAILFHTGVMDALYSLVDTQDKFETFVNEKARLSFYGDFLYPMASHATLEQYYCEKAEGDLSPQLLACRTSIWQSLSKFRLKLLRLSPAAFIHFGTTRELLFLMTCHVDNYRFLDWKKSVSGQQTEHFAVNNAVVERDCVIGDGSYLEDCLLQGKTIVGDGSIISHVTLNDAVVPGKVVLHGLPLTNGQFVVRIYGVDDNPKEQLEDQALLLGHRLDEIQQRCGIDLWSGKEHSIWQAKLYPVCDSLDEAVKAALNVYAIISGAPDADGDAFRKATRLSLCESFNMADARAIIDWQTHLRKIVKIEKLLRLIDNGGTIDEAYTIFQDSDISLSQMQILEDKAERSALYVKMRIFYFLGRILEKINDTDPLNPGNYGEKAEKYIQKAFAAIRELVLSGVTELASDSLTRDMVPKGVFRDTTVCLPLRVNFGGGWSDTPPYCNEHGGTVLNAAILLNDQRPVEVQVKHVSERKIVFESADMGTYGEFTNIAELQDCHNPYDPFALHKAALIACGIIGREGDNLQAVFDRLNGGLYLSTQVNQVPKGSGLGTSSILAGACIKALFQFTGRMYTDSDLYDYVLCMEQIMSTGGGWQDQIGGLTPGIKYITSHPGARQVFSVRHLELTDETKAELEERFALIYTGQRRLARNLLREVVGNYIGNNPGSMAALEDIQRLVAVMTFELERGNIDAFAALLDQHWQLSKKIDMGSTNTCIDQIFLAVSDLISGRMICGAGGGGFLQVILKRGVTKDQLRSRLIDVFQDYGVDVWDCRFMW